MVRTDWKTHVKFVISHWSVSISLIADLYHHQLTNRHYSFDSEDDFGSGCPNVSHQQQSFSELPSPYGIVNSHGIVEKTTMKTSIIFIYLPGSIDWCCTLLKLHCDQCIDFHHTVALDLYSLLSLFVCHCYSYYIDSTCSSRSSHRELIVQRKNKYLNQLKYDMYS